MIGTILNVVGIVGGSLAGILLGGRLSGKLRSTLVSGLGLFTLAYALQMFFKTENALVVLGGIIPGVLIGEWLDIENGLHILGSWLEKKFNRGGGGVVDGRERFIRGFMTASLVFCIGPIAILGSIQDGLSGDYKLLAIKSILDCFASVAFASSLGIGVMFSALPILVYQGAITLLAVQVQSVVSPVMMNEMTAAGGVILMGVAIGSLLEIKPIRNGNLLPALFTTPLLVAFLVWMGWM